MFKDFDVSRRAVTFAALALPGCTHGQGVDLRTSSYRLPGPVRDVVFCGDEKLCLLYVEQETLTPVLMMFDIATAHPVWKRSLRKSLFNPSLRLALSGEAIISSGPEDVPNDNIAIFSAQDGKTLSSFSIQSDTLHNSRVMAAATDFHLNYAYFSIGFEIVEIDLQKGRIRNRTRLSNSLGHSVITHKIEFISKKYLCAQTSLSEVSVFTPKLDYFVAPFSTFPGGITALCANGEALIVGGTSAITRTFIENGRPILNPAPAFNDINSLVHLHALPGGELIRAFQDTRSSVEALAASTNGGKIAAGLSNGSLMIWKTDGTLLLNTAPLYSNITSLSFDATGSKIAISRNNTITIHQVAL